MMTKKIRTIKLNPDKEVRFYDYSGDLVDVAVVPVPVDEQIEWEYVYKNQQDGFIATLTVDGNLTDFGVDQLEQGNIIVEYKGEEKDREVKLKELGKKMDDYVNGVEVEGVAREDMDFPIEGFKTELPPMPKKKLGNLNSEEYNVWLMELTDTDQRVITALHERDERIIEIEECIRNIMKVLTEHNETDGNLIESISLLADKVQKLGERKSDE